MARAMIKSAPLHASALDIQLKSEHPQICMKSTSGMLISHSSADFGAAFVLALSVK